GVVMLSCSVDFGSSGAPIFLLGPVPRIVSVVSAKAEMSGKPVALAAELSGELKNLEAALQRAPISEGPRRVKLGQKLPLNQGSSAKFVRP
ncbi:MAG: hypothetical protein AAGL98_13285, partial [Planctomycetota bacterium]